MATKFYTAWEINTGSLRSILKDALKKGEIDSNDIVWTGDDGSVAVAPTPADLEGIEVEMTDSGTVAEYLND